MKKFLLSGFLTAMIFSIYAQTQVGRTRYDLQTNNSVCRRVATNAAGEIVVTYTRSHLNAPGFTDRGTGYNYSSDNGATWSESTFTGAFVRDDMARTGWPNVVFTDSKEIVISHFADAAENGLQVLSRDLGTTTWTTLQLNSNNSTNPTNNLFADDATWARVANRGDSIFVIFGLIGTDMPGMTGGMQMYRSLDAGATWVGPDDIPMMNSTNFVRSGGDNYALDMNSNGKIAIVLGTYQVEVLTSTDWGASFTKQTVVATTDLNGVPNPLFDGLSGETLDTINTTDRSYAVSVDDNDMVHVWFGRTRSSKAQATTAGVNYFPLSVGLAYWNDQMGTEAQIIHESRLAAQQIELCNPLFTGQVFSSANGFGPQVNLYRASLTSMPNGSYDAAGNIYVAYSAMVPAAFDDVTDLASTNNVNVDGLHYRDIYVLKSADNGMTWEGPINVSNEPLKECVFPGVPRKVLGTDLAVVWQQDTIPGVNLQAPTGVVHPDVENEIIFVNVDVATITTPVDITCPTIIENTTGQNDITVFSGCDMDFTGAFTNDDVPTGENELTVEITDTTGISMPGTHNVNIYVVDAGGNSSDTIPAIIIVVADVTPPVVNLVGPASVDVLVGATYTDPGITYSDNACYPDATPVEVDNVNTAAVGMFTYEWTVTDNSGNATTVIRTVNVVNSDNVAPVFSDNGMQNMTVEACDTYTDPGVTAFDNIDFDVTSTVTDTTTFMGSVVPTVDPTVFGVYTVTYTAIDNAMNTSTYVRTVTVGDTQDPVITLSTTETVLYACKGETSFSFPNASTVDCDSAAALTDDRSLIDFDTPGNYLLTFTATDWANNSATKSVQIKVGEAPVPEFSYIVSLNTISVVDESTNGPSSWTWDWSATNTDQAFFPTASYSYGSNIGNHTVCLTVTNNFTSVCNVSTDDQQICKQVTIETGIAEVEALNASVTVSPNPSNGKVAITVSQLNLTNVNVTIINTIGAVIAQKTIANTSKSNSIDFDLGDNATGIYFVEITTDIAKTSKKLIIK